MSVLLVPREVRPRPPSVGPKITLAKQILRDHHGVEGLYPSEHLPSLRESAKARFAELLEAEIGNE